MRTQHLQELTKISKVSAMLLPFLRLAFYVSIGILLILPLVFFLSPTASSTDASYFSSSSALGVNAGDLAGGLLNIKDKLIFLSGLMATIGLITLGIWFTTKLILCFKNKDIFCPLSIYYAKKVAWIYLAYVILSTLLYFLLMLLNGIKNAVISPLGFSQDFIILGLLWMFVWILEIGTSLHTDSEMTI